MPWNSSSRYKWGFHDFGYPMTLQNFSKSPKLESTDSFTVLYQPAWSKGDWSLPSHHQSQLWSPAALPFLKYSGLGHHSWGLAQEETCMGQQFIVCQETGQRDKPVWDSVFSVGVSQNTPSSSQCTELEDVLAGLNVCSVRADAIHLGWASADCKTQLDEKGPKSETIKIPWHGQQRLTFLDSLLAGLRRGKSRFQKPFWKSTVSLVEYKGYQILCII